MIIKDCIESTGTHVALHAVRRVVTRGEGVGEARELRLSSIPIGANVHVEAIGIWLHCTALLLHEVVAESLLVCDSSIAEASVLSLSSLLQTQHVE